MQRSWNKDIAAAEKEARTIKHRTQVFTPDFVATRCELPATAAKWILSWAIPWFGRNAEAIELRIQRDGVVGHNE